ncbi:hypothetical protein THAOC_25700 [Thalassiosira oceanica]|uniref:Uncharacterized protein n=1 Tax=Thalassiosira oceanica TaxID=159749 RepID=K0RLS0_THAOC|nr:hypothetical protein THAOC_25700 [Thalassiosira oceanica]|eukprot:EJK54653.1 hypothetical protein THAOC_25700 [Thalassiosira oceanica]
MSPCPKFHRCWYGPAPYYQLSTTDHGLKRSRRASVLRQLYTDNQYRPERYEEPQGIQPSLRLEGSRKDLRKVWHGGVAGLARRAGRLETTRGFRHGWLLAVPPHPADGEVESASEIGGDEGYSARAESNPCAVTAWGVGQCRHHGSGLAAFRPSAGRGSVS